MGKVVTRRTVSVLLALEDTLGVNAPKARVAIEACREAWHVHDELVRWGHEVKLVYTTRVKKLGIGQHGPKTDRIDAECSLERWSRATFPRRMCCRPTGGRCGRT
jgi:transposase